MQVDADRGYARDGVARHYSGPPMTRRLMIDGIALTSLGYDVNEPEHDPAWGWSYRKPRRRA